MRATNQILVVTAGLFGILLGLGCEKDTNPTKVAIKASPSIRTFTCDPLGSTFSPLVFIGKFNVEVEAKRQEVNETAPTVELWINQVSGPDGKSSVPVSEQDVLISLEDDVGKARPVAGTAHDSSKTLTFCVWMRTCVGEAYIRIAAPASTTLGTGPEAASAPTILTTLDSITTDSTVVKLERTEPLPPTPGPGVLIADQKYGCGQSFWVDNGDLADAMNGGEPILVLPEEGGAIVYDLATMTVINEDMYSEFTPKGDIGAIVFLDSVNRPQVMVFGTNGTVTVPWVGFFGGGIASFNSVPDAVPFRAAGSGPADSALLVDGNSASTFGADQRRVADSDTLLRSSVTGKIVSGARDDDGTFYLLIEDTDAPHASCVYRVDESTGTLVDKLTVGNGGRRVRICGDFMLVSNEQSETLTVFLRNMAGEWVLEHASIPAGKIRTFTAVKRALGIAVAWGNGAAIRILRLNELGAIVVDATAGLPAGLSEERAYHARWINGGNGLAVVTEKKLARISDVVADLGVAEAVR